jgi:hypothetical protein
MADKKNELEKLRENFEGSAAQRAGLTFNDYVKLVQATPAKTATPKVTKSRGSNTPKQVGDMNQREAYNSIRDTLAAKNKGASSPTSSRSKVSKEEVKSNKKFESKKSNMAGMSYSPASVSAKSRKQQRAGGKGK